MKNTHYEKLCSKSSIGWVLPCGSAGMVTVVALVTAVAQVRSLAQKLPHAAGMAKNKIKLKTKNFK